MAFQISPLPAQPFAPLFGLSDEVLAVRGVQRVRVEAPHAAPCRVSLIDAVPGESVLLLNYEHQSAPTPYRSAHAIFVREHARVAEPEVGEVPDPLRRRTLSVRAFDAAGNMRDADLTEGRELEALVDRLFADPQTAYLHAHYARRGCYAARIDRA